MILSNGIQFKTLTYVTCFSDVFQACTSLTEIPDFWNTSVTQERRIFSIDVGNISDEDVEEYVRKIANKFKRNVILPNDNLKYDVTQVPEDYYL